MKVIVCTKYGLPDVLQFKEEEKPAPKEDEVLNKSQVKASPLPHFLLTKEQMFYIIAFAHSARYPVLYSFLQFNTLSVT
jgi:hypothetical protein